MQRSQTRSGVHHAMNDVCGAIATWLGVVAADYIEFSVKLIQNVNNSKSIL